MSIVFYRDAVKSLGAARIYLHLTPILFMLSYFVLLLLGVCFCYYA